MPKLYYHFFLLNQIKNMVKIDEHYYDYADTLTPFGVAVWYPNELSLEDRHAYFDMKSASEIMTWTHVAWQRK